MIHGSISRFRIWIHKKPTKNIKDIRETLCKFIPTITPPREGAGALVPGGGAYRMSYYCCPPRLHSMNR